MHQTTYTAVHLRAILNRGGRRLSVQKHDLAGIPAGTVLGWHRTHYADCKRAGPGEFTTVCAVVDAIADCTGADFVGG